MTPQTRLLIAARALKAANDALDAAEKEFNEAVEAVDKHITQPLPTFREVRGILKQR